jgi:F-box domain
MEGWLIHAILAHLSPRDLIGCGLVSREFYALSRADKAWERHKLRVLHYCPTLASIFDAHPQETDGKRVKKRAKRTPQGTWYIFCRFLMRNPFKLACERRKTRFAAVVTDAVLFAAMQVLIWGKPHITQLGMHQQLNADKRGYTCINNFNVHWFFTVEHRFRDVDPRAEQQYFRGFWNRNSVFVGYRNFALDSSTMVSPFLYVVHDQMGVFEIARELVYERLPMSRYYL